MLTGQDELVNLDVELDTRALTIQLVMTMLGRSSSTLSVGDWNKRTRFSRLLTWIEVFCMLPIPIANTVAITCSVFSEPGGWDYGFPWRLSIAVLLNIYMEVVYLAIRYLNLFLPQAPFVAWKFLLDVGFKGVGMLAIGASVVVIVMFDQAWLHIYFACLLGALIAAVIALWVWLVRNYGGHQPLSPLPV